MGTINNDFMYLKKDKNLLAKLTRDRERERERVKVRVSLTV